MKIDYISVDQYPKKESTQFYFILLSLILSIQWRNAVPAERLNRHHAVQLLCGEHFPVIGIDARHAVTLRYQSSETRPQLGQGDHLAVRQGSVVAQVRALSHTADADESETYLCHVPSFDEVKPAESQSVYGNSVKGPCLHGITHHADTKILPY